MKALGIIFIHGIGNQKKGETLTDSGDSLVGFLQDWLSHSGNTDFSSIRVTDTTIKHLDEETPPNASIEILNKKDEVKEEWILSESYWANSFHPPNSTEVLQWLMLVAHYLMISTFARFIAFKYAQLKYSRSYRGLLVLQLVYLYLTLVLVFLSGPFVFFALFLLWIFSLIPIPFFEKQVAAILKTISSIIGDSYAFSSSEIRLSGITSKVLSDIEWLKSKCKKIVIIAHSQGAAIAAYSLTLQMPKELSLLVTVGSGLSKLSLLKSKIIDTKNTLSLKLHSGLLMSFTVWGVALVLFPILKIIPVYLTILVSFSIVFVILASLYMFVFSHVDNQPDEIKELDERLKKNQTKWLDIYSSNDPVSSGRLFIKGLFTRNFLPSAYYHKEVMNKFSFISDHTSYNKNSDEYFPLLIKNIFECGSTRIPLIDLAPNDRVIIEAMAKSRWERVTFYVINKLLLTFGFLLFLINIEVVSDMGASFERTLIHYELTSSNASDSYSHFQLGVVVLMLIFGIAFLFNRLLFYRNERIQLDHFYERKYFFDYDSDRVDYYRNSFGSSFLSAIAFSYALFFFGLKINCFLISLIIAIALWLIERVLNKRTGKMLKQGQ